MNERLTLDIGDEYYGRGRRTQHSSTAPDTGLVRNATTHARSSSTLYSSFILTLWYLSLWIQLYK